MIRLFPDPADAGPPGQPAPQPAAPAPTQTAAEVVLNGKSQREIELEGKLETEAAARRKAELDALEAQATVQQLKDIDSRRPVPAKVKKTRQLFPWSPVHTEADDESED